MTTDRILFAEWADGSGPGLLGDRIDRSECPVCGHPTGDCTHPFQGVTVMAKTTAATAPSPVANAEPSAPTEAEIKQSAKDVAEANGAVVVAADGTVESGNYDENDNNEVYVTLNKDVLEEFYYPDTKRPSYRVLYTKGQVIAKSVIDAYNAAVEAKKAGAPEGDDAVRATIDQTTLASGTYPGVAPAAAESTTK